MLYQYESQQKGVYAVSIAHKAHHLSIVKASAASSSLSFQEHFGGQHLTLYVPPLLKRDCVAVYDERHIRCIKPKSPEIS